MKPICTRTLVKIALAAFALFLAIYYWPAMARFLGLLLSACLPLLLGLCFAYLINILMSFYERHFFPASQRRAILKMRPGLCLTLAILTLLGIFAFIVGMVAPQLAACPAIERVYPSDANFILVRTPDPDRMYDALISAGVIVRNRSRIPGCEGCLRITVGTPAENARMIETVKNFRL